MADRLHYARPYLDAVAWINALSGRGPHADDLAQVLAAADRAELVLVTSMLMPLEVLGGRFDERTAESAERAMQALARSTVMRVGVSTRVVTDARDLRVRLNLKAMDALHLASAAAGRADAFLTDDDQLVALASHRGVPIIRPEWYGTFSMDFRDDDEPPVLPEGT